jgi:hypothetical protein
VLLAIARLKTCSLTSFEFPFSKPRYRYDHSASKTYCKIKMANNAQDTQEDIEAQQHPILCCCRVRKETPAPVGASTASIDPASYVGYRSIAKTMAMKGNDFAVFRKFGYLNMLSLLSLQAELMTLQAQFKDICKRNDAIPLPGNETDGGVADYAFNFSKLRESAGLTGDDARKEQWEKLEEIRKKLGEYSESGLKLFIRT